MMVGRHAPAAPILLLLAALTSRAAAEEPGPAAAPTTPLSVEQRLGVLEEQNASLLRDLRLLRKDHHSSTDLLRRLLSRLSGRLTGYLDFGFFWVGGNGSGIIADTGHERYPEYKDVPDSWVFLGDPLSTAVNSRGEPADTGTSRAVTWNPIHNGGAASAILNALNVGLFVGLGPDLTVHSSIDFVPRSRNVSDPQGVALGDFIDLKLAYVEYAVPIDAFDLRISAGKVDSVLGIEYRSQESPARIGVIPSLICRYTCGRPLGLKVRGRFLSDLLVVAVSVTNGSHFSEMFPFQNEIDVNHSKTVAGRLSTKLPIGAGLELGASAAYGAQDFQSANNVPQWHYGVDLHLEIRGLDVRGEFVQGAAEGQDQMEGMFVACGIAPCLHYKGAYGQIFYRVLNWLVPYARVDWRDAIHQSGQSFVYVSKLLRFTGGLHVELGTNVIIKAEYTLNRELGDIPQFPNDVLTSSLLVKY